MQVTAHIRDEENDMVASRAAVAHQAGKPLTIETIEVEGPREGEVLVEIKATGICHTDAFTLSGADPEGLFPSVLGHEGAGVVVDTGAGVTSVKKGDHVIPLYTPECRQCTQSLMTCSMVWYIPFKRNIFGLSKMKDRGVIT